jgi:IS5 family transposase
MRQFAGLDLGRDAIPDETAILAFRHLLERGDLTKALFDAVTGHLEEHKLLLRGGTVVDATLIAAPPSTKNKERKRDPEMSHSKKGNAWHFGMKTHIGVDAKSGFVHTAGVTTGSVHDAKAFDKLLREDDRAIFGDKGYVNEGLKRRARAAGAGGGRLLGREGEAQAWARAVPFAKEAQQETRRPPGESGACFPGDEMPVRLPQDALSRDRQERRAGLLALGPRQSLHGAKQAHGGGGIEQPPRRPRLGTGEAKGEGAREGRGHGGNHRLKARDLCGGVRKSRCPEVP